MKKPLYFLFLILLLSSCAQEQNDTTSETTTTSPPTPTETVTKPASIEPYSAGDALTIFAPSGLVLREEPSPSGKKIEVLPYGTQAEVMSEDLRTHAYTVTEMEGFDIEGYWVKVKAAGKEGYLFDGYLSHFPIPKEDEFGSEYLARISKLSSTSSEAPADNPYLFSYLMNTYENGASFEEGYTEGGGFQKIMLPTSSCSFAEAYLLANALFMVGGENLKYEFDPESGHILGSGGDDTHPYGYTLSREASSYLIDFGVSD